MLLQPFYFVSRTVYFSKPQPINHKMGLIPFQNLSIWMGCFDPWKLISWFSVYQDLAIETPVIFQSQSQTILPVTSGTTTGFNSHYRLFLTVRSHGLLGTGFEWYIKPEITALKPCVLKFNSRNDNCRFKHKKIMFTKAVKIILLCAWGQLFYVFKVGLINFKSNDEYLMRATFVMLTQSSNISSEQLSE